MGYSYCNGKLCCDICGEPGARKRPCPHAYCPQVACCTGAACKAKLAAHRKAYCATSCKTFRAESDARDRARQAKLAGGAFLRCAAVSVDGFADCVQVWFEGTAGQRIRFMATATYHAFWGLDVVEESDFAARGLVTAAPQDFETR